MTKNVKSLEGEIDIRELVMALWAHKIFIVFVTVLSIFYGGYYALTTEKKFVAEARFLIKEQGNSGFKLPGELGALASLAGIPSASKASGSETLLERLDGREFIVGLMSRINLDSDPYFNAYSVMSSNQKENESIWKANKEACGYKTKPQKKFNGKEYHRNFRNNVKFDTTKAELL